VQGLATACFSVHERCGSKFLKTFGCALPRSYAERGSRGPPRRDRAVQGLATACFSVYER
jgi:hypothetical protein